MADDIVIGEIRIELDDQGFKDVLNSPEVAQMLEEKAEKIKKAANSMATSPYGHAMPPFGAKLHQAKDRKVASVYTRTHYGRNAQAKHNILTKAMGAGK